MPCTNTSNLPQALVRLSWQFLRTPTMSNALESVTLRYSDNIHGFVLREHILEVYWLLEQSLGVGNLVCDRSSVELNLHDLCLLLVDACEMMLVVGEDTDDGAIFANPLDLLCDRLVVFCGFLGIFSERLLLAAVPIAVESPLEIVRQVIRPDGGESAETAGSFDVANNADNDHGWCFDDGDSFDDFPLVHLYGKNCNRQ